MFFNGSNGLSSGSTSHSDTGITSVGSDNSAEVEQCDCESEADKMNQR
jgi:hypothetical protein